MLPEKNLVDNSSGAESTASPDTSTPCSDLRVESTLNLAKLKLKSTISKRVKNDRSFVQSINQSNGSVSSSSSSASLISNNGTDTASTGTVGRDEKNRMNKVSKISSNGSASSSYSSVDSSSSTASPADFQTPVFQQLTDNLYEPFERKKPSKKDRDFTKSLICECSYEEALRVGHGCDKDCLNRLMYYECSTNCPCAELCTNRRFQEHQYAKVVTFDAGKKGTGLRAVESLPRHTFVMEYVGEILSSGQFKQRSKIYAKDSKHKHHYFMALKTDQIIDATKMGNLSRFINHSCDPNCETQKWTVNGNLRIGFFTIRDVEAGAELTFDYKFQRYGKEAQKCYCAAENCRGYIDGGETMKKLHEKDDKKKSVGIFSDNLFDREFDDILSLRSLKNREQVILFGRLMVRAEDFISRRCLLDLLLSTDQMILKIFTEVHGCTLLWSWTVEDQNNNSQQATWCQFQNQLLDVLDLLPIPHKTMLVDSRLLPVVEKWSKLDITSLNCLENIEFTVKCLLKEMISEICMDSTDKFDGFDITEIIRIKSANLLKKWSALKEMYKIPKRLTKDEKSSYVADSKDVNSQSILRTFNGTQGQYASPFQSAAHFKVKRPFEGAISGVDSKRVKEERRRAFEQRVAKAEMEEKYNKEILENFYNSANSVTSSTSGFDSSYYSPFDPKLQYSLQYPGQSITYEEFVAACTSQQQESTVEMLVPVEFQQDAVPAELMHDPITAKWWWVDRTTGVLVYPARDDQLMAYRMGDISAVPHFCHDPTTGLIHEIQAKVPSTEFPVDQTYDESNLDQRLENLLKSSSVERCLEGSEGRKGKIRLLKQKISSLQLELKESESELQKLLAEESDVRHLATLIKADKKPPKKRNQPQPSPDVPRKLPKNWRSAKDSDGKVYYYHTKTKFTQWEFPEDEEEEEQQQLQNQHQQQQTDGQPTEIDDEENISILSDEIQDEEQELTPDKQENVEILEISQKPKARLSKSSYRRRITDGSKEKRKAALKLKRIASRNRTTRLILSKSRLSAANRKSLANQQNSTVENLEKVDTEVSGENFELKWSKIEQGVSSSPKRQIRRISFSDQVESINYVKNESPASSTNGQNEFLGQKSPFVNKSCTMTAAADTSGGETAARRAREAFKSSVSNHVVKCLNPYRRPDCSTAHITCNDDFKHLARKLTHAILEKELKHCHVMQDLKISQSVLNKAKDYIKRYMSKLGPVYKRTIGSGPVDSNFDDYL